jgi:hypothetical protein
MAGRGHRPSEYEISAGVREQVSKRSVSCNRSPLAVSLRGSFVTELVIIDRKASGSSLVT